MDDTNIAITVRRDCIGHKVRSIFIDKTSGVKAIYCMQCDKIAKYRFRRNRGWSLEKAVQYTETHQNLYKTYKQINLDQIPEFIKVVGTADDGSTAEYEPKTESFIMETEKTRFIIGLGGDGIGHYHGFVDVDDEGNGITEVSNDHTHQVTNKEVQPTNGHTHPLIDIATGYEYEKIAEYHTAVLKSEKPFNETSLKTFPLAKDESVLITVGKYEGEKTMRTHSYHFAGEKHTIEAVNECAKSWSLILGDTRPARIEDAHLEKIEGLQKAMYHRARMKDPNDFQQNTFRIIAIDDKAGVHAIVGKMHGEDTMTIQAYLFDKDKMSAAEGKKWLKDHDLKPMSFVERKEEKRMTIESEFTGDEGEMTLVKVDEDKRLVYGVFLWPEKADHDGDVISIDDVEKVAHGFMADYRTIDEMHEDVIHADIVESAIAWKDGLDFHGKMLSKGAWFGAVKVSDDVVWEKIKNGTYKGFSVRISGVREPIEG